jgi:hypothetical protein
MDSWSSRQDGSKDTLEDIDQLIDESNRYEKDEKQRFEYFNKNFQFYKMIKNKNNSI